MNTDGSTFELKRLACVLLPQLPDDKRQAERVLTYLRQLLDMAHAPDEPNGGSVVRLRPSESPESA
jgi:hypothetical protein